MKFVEYFEGTLRGYRENDTSLFPVLYCGAKLRFLIMLKYFTSEYIGNLFVNRNASRTKIIDRHSNRQLLYFFWRSGYY